MRFPDIRAIRSFGVEPMRRFFAAASCLVGLVQPDLTIANDVIYETRPSACAEFTQQDQACDVCGGASMGSACSSGCQTCAPPACNVCGTAPCWDCSNEEGIDLESLTPEAQSKKLYEASLARIKFVGPEDAGVSLQGQKMTTLGAKRSFVVSVDDQSKVYKYEIKIDVVRNGKKYFKKHKIEKLRAGMILVLNVEAPDVAEDMPAVIVIAPVPEAEGGEPKDSNTPVDEGGEDEKDRMVKITKTRE